MNATTHTGDTATRGEVVLPLRGTTLHIHHDVRQMTAVSSRANVVTLCATTIRHAERIKSTHLREMDRGFYACADCFAGIVPLGFENVDGSANFRGWK